MEFKIFNYVITIEKDSKSLINIDKDGYIIYDDKFINTTLRNIRREEYIYLNKISAFKKLRNYCKKKYDAKPTIKDSKFFIEYYNLYDWLNKCKR